MYLEWTFIYLYIFIRNSYLAYLCNCIFCHRTNQLCVPPAHKLMVAVPIMTLKSISVCLSVLPPPAHPSIHPIHPSVRPPAWTSIHPYLSIYLSTDLVPKCLGTETPCCRNVLVLNRPGNFFRLVPKRLGAETSRAESSRCGNDLVPKRL